MTTIVEHDPTTAPATADQLRLLYALIHEREITTIKVKRKLTEAGASELLDLAFAHPRIRKPSVSPGYYLYDDAVVWVKANKAGTGKYAQRLELEGEAFATGRWRYVPGLISVLTVEHRLSAKDAADFGREHEVCAVCAKRVILKAGIHTTCKTNLKESNA